MSDSGVDGHEARRRKAHLLAKEIGLSREDRIELAQFVLHRDIESWKGLDEDQLNRLLDALTGYQLITHLRSQA